MAMAMPASFIRSTAWKPGQCAIARPQRGPPSLSMPGAVAAAVAVRDDENAAGGNPFAHALQASQAAPRVPAIARKGYTGRLPRIGKECTIRRYATLEIAH